jgi:hypothetical protein
MLTVSLNATGNICEAMGSTYGYNWWTAQTSKKDFDFSQIAMIKIGGYTKIGTIPERLL